MNPPSPRGAGGPARRRRHNRDRPMKASTLPQASPATATRQGDRVGEVYRRLRDLIVEGRLAPGSRIVELEIADRLQVSRTPVRGALIRLLQEGYVVATDGNRRTRLAVAPLTRDDGAELFTLIAEVEGLAGRYAAQLDAQARARLAAEIKTINTDLRRAARAPHPDPRRWFDLDRAFHQRYVEAVGRVRVRAIHEAIKPQVERYARVYTNVLTETILTSVAEHDAIVAAIEGGDPAAAQLAIQANWRNAAERLSSVIEHVGERGSW